MDVLVRDGDMVTDAKGIPLYISGVQQMLQRVLFALKTRKGDFRYNPELGLEEFTLETDERGIRNFEARCREAVMNIEGVRLSVENAERLQNGRIKAVLLIDYQGENYRKEVTV